MGAGAGLRGKARLQKVLDRVAPAEGGRDAEEAGNDRADGQRQERHRHRPRRLVRAMPRTMAVAAVGIVSGLSVGRTMRHLVIGFVRGQVGVRIRWMRCTVARDSDVFRARARHMSAMSRRLPRRSPVRAEERHGDQPEHVERRHEGGGDGKQPDGLVREERAEEDLVLAEEPRQRRDSGDGQRADEHRGERHGKILLQPAHVTHVLLTGHGMDD